MRFRGLLYDRFGRPRLVPAALVAFALSLAIVLGAMRLLTPPLTEEGTARALIAQGKAGEAEAIYARRLKEQPSVPRLLALFEAHRAASALSKFHRHPIGDDDAFSAPAPISSSRPMSDAELDAIVDALPPDVALIGHYLRGDEDAKAAITLGAEAEPPLPWANHLLAGKARAADDDEEAARRYLREGLAFPERSEDIDFAIAIWIDAGAWDSVRDEMADPRVAAALGPQNRYEYSVHEADWRGAFRAFLPMWRDRFHGSGLWLSAVAALAWGFFCARLGRAGDRPLFRIPLYLVAFALGVLSIVPTVALISIEESKLHLVETGDLARDAIVCVFGVGLREEASKLLLFSLLLPILRRWGDKLDVLACGAMVGLGFAAEENLGYFSEYDLHSALARFLTANFLHMAMTGTLASALDDFVRDGERHGRSFFQTSLLVVGLHGAYDLLIGHEEIGGGYMAMIVFVVLTKMFLDAIEVARKKADRGLTPVHAFVVALAVVTGASMAHAIGVVGPAAAPLVMASGLLGEAIMVFVFVRIFSVL